MSQQSLRTPLGRVVGLGSAKDGTKHWWLQRVSAIALVPLVFWFVASLAALAGADQATIAGWLQSPVAALAMILLLGTGFFHLKLGLQVVIEDYVHVEWARVALLLLNTFACIAVGGGAVLAVLTMLFKG